MARSGSVIDAGSADAAGATQEAFSSVIRMQYSPPSVQSIRVWVWREACHSGAQRVANWLCLFACSNPKPTVYKFPGRTGPVRLVMWERAR